MKKVIIVTTKLFQYRIGIYNYFSKHLERDDIDLYVLATNVQENISEEIEFKYKIYSGLGCLYFMQKYKPDVVITFLNLRDLVIWPLIHYLKLKSIPFVYWGHGTNLQDPNNKIKGLFFQYIHNLSNSILLYTPNQIKYIEKKNRHKVFVANNTLNFNEFPIIKESKYELRKEMGIHFKKVLLFVSRILPYKRVKVLIDIFEEIQHLKDIGLIIVGQGMPENLVKKINNMNNVVYLGGIYDRLKINKVFKLSDLFSIPGANGLSVNQAMYWGLPCLTLDVLQGPEAWYIKQGETGFILKNVNELKERILYLFNNNDELARLSENSKKLMQTDGNIEQMFKGFYNAIKHNF